NGAHRCVLGSTGRCGIPVKAAMVNRITCSSRGGLVTAGRQENGHSHKQTADQSVSHRRAPQAGSVLLVFFAESSSCCVRGSNYGDLDRLIVARVCEFLGVFQLPEFFRLASAPPSTPSPRPFFTDPQVITPYVAAVQ